MERARTREHEEAAKAAEAMAAAAQAALERERAGRETSVGMASSVLSETREELDRAKKEARERELEAAATKEALEKAEALKAAAEASTKSVEEEGASNGGQTALRRVARALPCRYLRWSRLD